VSFTHCRLGHTHWGQYGAAGLLLVDQGRVLLQLRPAGVHEGGTWSIPGGARGDSETATATALREAAEETGLDPNAVRVASTHTQDCGGWQYVTVIAQPTGALDLAGNWETEQLRWVPLADVAALQLHPGFRDAWPALRDIASARPANISRITERLWTGGDRASTPMATYLAQIQSAGITHIIDARPHGRADQAYAQAHAPHISYLLAGQLDNGQTMPDDWFADGVDFALHAMRDPAAKVLAHCQLGINRGPSMAFAILLAQGMKATDALATIRAARPIARVAYADDATAWWARLTAPPVTEPIVFYHGGRPGLHVGDLLLPPTESGARPEIDFLDLNFHANLAHAASLVRRDRVYLTSSKNDATVWASLHRLGTPTRGGDVYRAEPIGSTEPDPDYNGPDTVVHCARARIVEVVGTHVHRGSVVMTTDTLGARIQRLAAKASEATT
jgi:8-oxo-dGTP pyrophosphatase MutT (NUDIX family)